ncbi:MAG: amidohydrolase family protein [Alphaproteobacteria bacterium]|nr:amidohydrolase family protein [Alphaproteobacteria bacterium]
MHYDLKITGGTIVNGTGKPGYAGDVAVTDGRIAAVGHAPGEARATIDAAGRVVCPGFIDIHTHYDAQIVWDPLLSISPWHGVTTAIMGNCGFSIAPTSTDKRDLMLRTLERVEGMSLEALRTGVRADWPIESFPAYLDAIAKRGILINVGAYIGHTPVRITVMGEDAVKRHATRDEIKAMAKIVREANEAGAVGFTTSMTKTQFAYDGHPIPSRLSDWTEVETLVAAAAAGGGRALQNSPGSLEAVEVFSLLAGKYDLAYTWTAILAGLDGPGSHRRFLDEAHKRVERGLRVYPQTSPQPQQFEFTFDAPIVFDRNDLFAATRKADHAGRLAIYRDGEFRRRFKELVFDGFDILLNGWTERAVITHAPTDPSLDERTLGEVAAERGVDPVDLALDLSLASDLNARFRLDVVNFDRAEVGEILNDPVGVVAFSDAGAHASQLCNVNYTTHIMQHWVRETGVLKLEQAVWMLTARPAEVVGLTDRGTLATGMAADIVVFDPKTIGASKLRRVNDLPAGAPRVVVDAFGIDAVIVNGRIVRRNGQAVVQAGDKLPGKLLRGAKAV